MIPASTYHPPRFADAFPAKAEALATEKIEVEHKIFYLDLLENHRGRFLRISEDAGGRRASVIVSIEDARQFAETVKRIIVAVP